MFRPGGPATSSSMTPPAPPPSPPPRNLTTYEYWPGPTRILDMPSKTYDELIAELNHAKSDVESDVHAIADLQAKQAADQLALDTADEVLDGLVQATGGIGVVNSDGTITAYEPSGTGYAVKTLVQSTAFVPEPPAPPEPPPVEPPPVEPPAPPDVPAPPLT